MQLSEYLEPFATTLWEEYQKKNPITALEISNYHPDWLGKDHTLILESALSRVDCFQTIASEFGFSNWELLTQHPEIKVNPDFENAVEAIINGQLEDLKKSLTANPELIKMTSTFGHQAGLIHYVASNGVEIWRQIVPFNLLEITHYLLESGANPDQPHQIYGGNCSLIDLIATSAHPEKAGLQQELIQFIQSYR